MIHGTAAISSPIPIPPIPPLDFSPRPPSAGDMIHGTAATDPLVPLANLSAVRSRMDSLHRFLYDSLNGNTILPKHQLDMVSAEIASAIPQVIINGAALLTGIAPALNSSPSQIPNLPSSPRLPHNQEDEDLEAGGAEEESGVGDGDDNFEVVEPDAVELLADHVHICGVCGKGFKRDANLRMHMRAHGDRFKTPQALAAKPDGIGTRKTRFSCPFAGCSRNRRHSKFRPLKSAVCVKNHFKRSHCPKMYSCDRCNRKRFAVVADLKSHRRNCGRESKWRCSCGTSFSRKDKLFGHMALFEGHMPAIAIANAEEGVKEVGILEEEDHAVGKEVVVSPIVQLPASVESNGDLPVGEGGMFDDGLLERFGSLEDYSSLQEILGMEGIFNL